MAQGLTIDEIINIDTSVQAGGTISAVFGTGLMMTTSEKLAGSGANKCLRFGSQNEVISYFGGTDGVTADAAAWFGADPAPQALYIGRWVQTTAANTIITSPALEGDAAVVISDLRSVTNGNFTLNGAQLTSDISFSSVSDLAGVASLLQTAIRTVSAFSTATVAYSATTKKISINFGSTTHVDIGAPDASKTEFMSRLFLVVPAAGSDAPAPTIFQGQAAQSITDAVNQCVALTLDGPPTGLMLASDVPSAAGSVDTRQAMRNFAQTGDYMYAMLDTSTAGKESGSTDALSSANTANQSNVIPVYSRGTDPGENTPPKPDVAILAKLSSQNFNLPQSIITLPPKDLPSVNPTIVTGSELVNLRNKRTSVYTLVGGLPTLLGGYTARDGVWADAQWWLLWLKNEMERSIFQAMRTSNRLSNAELTDTINDVMAKAVNSGGAQPGGRVNNSIKHAIRRTTGDNSFDGVMQTGYVLWIDPPQSQTDADRSARVSRFTIWVAPSEAIHTISSAIILSG